MDPAHAGPGLHLRWRLGWLKGHWFRAYQSVRTALGGTTFQAGRRRNGVGLSGISFLLRGADLDAHHTRSWAPAAPGVHAPAGSPHVQLVIVGGSIALILPGYRERATTDIDVVDELPAEIRSQHALLDDLRKPRPE